MKQLRCLPVWQRGRTVFVAVSDPDTLNAMRQTADQYGEDWPIRWLQNRGINIHNYVDVDKYRRKH